jgi:hypothetical protein
MMQQQPVVTKTGASCSPEFLHSSVGSDAIVQQPAPGAWRIEGTIDSKLDRRGRRRRKVAVNLIEAIEKMGGS